MNNTDNTPASITPGEWILQPYQTQEFDYLITDKRNNPDKTVPICAVYASNINYEAEANAKYICKAVNSHALLLEALRPLANLDLTGVTGDIVYQRDGTYIKVQDVLNAKAAIAAAEKQD